MDSPSTLLPRHPPGGPPSGPGFPQPDNGGNSLATAALALGIVAIVLFFYTGVGIVLGVLAIVFGVLGRVHAKSRGLGTGRATTGIALGFVAIVIGSLLLVFWAVLLGGTSDHFIGKTITPARTHATITHCGSSPWPPPRTGLKAEAYGTIKNPEGSVRSFEFKVEFFDADNVRLFASLAAVDTLGTGETAQWHTEWPPSTPSRATRCSIVQMKEFSR